MTEFGDASGCPDKSSAAHLGARDGRALHRGRGERGEDFRTTTAAVSHRDNALLDALMRDVRARQQLVREVLVEEEASPLPFVASARIEHGARQVTAAIRNTLGITEEQQRSAKDASALFTLMRAAAERAGIYVLMLGDLGSHHSDIDEDVFRGFALADEIAPFIVINDNDNDAERARAFTLLHELDTRKNLPAPPSM